MLLGLLDSFFPATVYFNLLRLLSQGSKGAVGSTEVANRLFVIAGCFIYAFDLTSLDQLYVPGLLVFISLTRDIPARRVRDSSSLPNLMNLSLVGRYLLCP